jgi:hypothetical protein
MPSTQQQLEFSVVGRGQRSAANVLALLLPLSHADTGLEEASSAPLISFAIEPERSFTTENSRNFDASSAVPKRFNRSKSKYGRRTAVSWFKHMALGHVAKMRALIIIVEKNGYHVSQITTDRPGYAVFEDDHQAVAEPFRGEMKRK